MQLESNILFHNRYRLIEMKGRGSFGEVWLAHDEHLDMDVAIKVYIALDDRGVAEFKLEYKTTFGLNHPNLLHANHFDQCESRPYLVMPYCPDAVTNYIGNIDEPTLWRFIRDVSAGLEYLHSMGIIHHDIKPDNVLIDMEGNFLITDFGISKKIRSTLRRNSMRQEGANDMGGGSISYMAPEMFGPKPESVNATDIWALGATLYELCEGELPFFGQGGGMQLNGALVPELKANFSDDLKQIVQACMARNILERPAAAQLHEYAQAKVEGQTPAEFGSMMSSSQPLYQSGDTQPEKSNANKEKTEPKKKPKVWGWVIGIAVVIAIAAGVVYYMMMQPKESPEQKLAQENVTVYLSKVNACESLIQSGTYEDYHPLLTAREELAEIKKLEDAGKAYVPESYNDFDILKNRLDSKCQEIGKQYEDLALTISNNYKEFGDPEDKDQALMYYSIVKQLIPEFDSDEYKELRQ